MSYPDNVQPPRLPALHELSNAAIDLEIHQNQAEINELSHTMAVTTDPEVIKDILLNQNRMMFLKGILAIIENPKLLDEILFVDKRT